MSLQSYTENLSKEKQFDLGLRLLKLALPAWDQYAAANELSYHDSVVGVKHTVDRKLPLKSVDAVEEYLNLNKLKKESLSISKLLDLLKQYREPIAALQDHDWQVPDEVLKTFYAGYNLIESVAGQEKTVFGESTIMVAINQAADALTTSKAMTPDEINAMLTGG